MIVTHWNVEGSVDSWKCKTCKESVYCFITTLKQHLEGHGVKIPIAMNLKHYFDCETLSESPLL